MLGADRLLGTEQGAQAREILAAKMELIVDTLTVLVVFVEAKARDTADLIIENTVGIEGELVSAVFLELIDPFVGRLTSLYKGFIAEVSQVCAVLFELVVHKILVSVDVELCHLVTLLSVKIGVLVDEDAVVVKDDMTSEALDLCNGSAKSFGTAELFIYLIMGIAVVKSALPPTEKQDGIESAFLTLKVNAGQLGKL